MSLSAPPRMNDPFVPKPVLVSSAIDHGDGKDNECKCDWLEQDHVYFSGDWNPINTNWTSEALRSLPPARSPQNVGFPWVGRILVPSII
jgi:hypothetical protein